MRKILTVIFLIIVVFFIEYLLAGLFGNKYIPNFLLLTIIFINLTLGIRYSLLAAALGGIIKDSFGFQLFGLYTFSFILSAYMTTILARYIYQKGSRITLFFLILAVCIINLITQCTLSLSFLRFGQVFNQIFIPEILATIIVTNYTFKQLRICALRLFG